MNNEEERREEEEVKEVVGDLMTFSLDTINEAMDTVADAVRKASDEHSLNVLLLHSSAFGVMEEALKINLGMSRGRLTEHQKEFVERLTEGLIIDQVVRK